MSNCIPCPPCEIENPLVCEPYGTVSTGNRLMVEDDAFCTKTLKSPSGYSSLVWDNGIKWQDGIGNWQKITTNYAAKNADKLSANTSSGALQITLPSNPGQFEEIIIADHFASWQNNNVLVLRNGSLIENKQEDLVLNTGWPNQIILRFDGATWRVYSII